MGKHVAFNLEPSNHLMQGSVISLDSGGRTWEVPPKSRAGAGRKGRRESNAKRTLLLAAIVGAMLLAAYTSFTGHSAFSVHTMSMAGMHGMSRFGDGSADTLVIYVYAHTDVEYAENLRFFLEFGVEPNDGCDYLVVVQEGKGVLSTNLPALPDNVQAVYHPNECFDWGTFGWAIENRIVDTSRYRYIIFLNSSVRGPFVPAYWPSELHWSRVLTNRLNDDVKLVGATISCEGANKGGVLSGEMRRNPHVQSYVVATDQTGLGLLQSDGDVLKCYKSIHDAIWYAEIGSSAAILEAGFNIDALMLRYQGVDWRDKANWGCNAGINPYAEFMYDGVNISPFEVMFVKVKEFLLEANWTTATSAKKYTTWLKGQDQLHENEYNAKRTELRNMKVLNMRARGSACFDFDFYRLKNPDLPVWGHETMWEHFVTSGQHEGRVFRFRCKPGAVEFPKPPPSPKKAHHASPAAEISVTHKAANTTTPTTAGAGASQGGGANGAAASGDVISTQQAAQAQQAAAAQKAAADAQQAGQAQQAAAADGGVAVDAAAAGAAAGQAAGAAQQAAAAGAAAGQAAGAAQQAAAAGAAQQATAAAGQAADAQQAAAGQAAAAAQHAAATAAGAGQAAATVQQAAAAATGASVGQTAAVAQQAAAATTAGAGQAAAAASQGATAAAHTAGDAGASAGQTAASAQQAASAQTAAAASIGGGQAAGASQQTAAAAVQGAGAGAGQAAGTVQQAAGTIQPAVQQPAGGTPATSSQAPGGVAQQQGSTAGQGGAQATAAGQGTAQAAVQVAGAQQGAAAVNQQADAAGAAQQAAQAGGSAATAAATAGAAVAGSKEAGAAIQKIAQTQQAGAVQRQ